MRLPQGMPNVIGNFTHYSHRSCTAKGDGIEYKVTQHSPGDISLLLMRKTSRDLFQKADEAIEKFHKLAGDHIRDMEATQEELENSGTAEITVSCIWLADLLNMTYNLGVKDGRDRVDDGPF